MVLNNIQDKRVTKLVKYKQGSATAQITKDRLEEGKCSKESPGQQKIVYKLTEITEYNICDVKRFSDTYKKYTAVQQKYAVIY